MADDLYVIEVYLLLSWMWLVGMWLSCSLLRWTWLDGVGSGICIRSLSHDMILDVALDLQNLHIHFNSSTLSIRPLKYTVNTYIYYTYTHKIEWVFCLYLCKNQCLITVLTSLLHDERSLELAYAQNW